MSLLKADSSRQLVSNGKRLQPTRARHRFASGRHVVGGVAYQKGKQRARSLAAQGLLWTMGSASCDAPSGSSRPIRAGLLGGVTHARSGDEFVAFQPRLCSPTLEGPAFRKFAYVFAASQREVCVPTVGTAQWSTKVLPSRNGL
ncbi:hypothetical protein MTO96_000768 [Rhipicephalus appendiculatus]